MRTTCDTRRARSCQATARYSPGGMPAMRNFPEASGTAKCGLSRTRTTALMSEWMWQKTLTIPGVSKRTDFDSPRGKRPRSNVEARDSEKTLWKTVSAFGNSTVEPFTTGRTCGVKASPSWRTAAASPDVGRESLTRADAGPEDASAAPLFPLPRPLVDVLIVAES